MPYTCVSESGQHWFRLWLVACSAPSLYRNQCSLIVNYTLRNKFQWNSNWNSIIFIQENAFEIIVCRNGGHFVQWEWVNTLRLRQNGRHFGGDIFKCIFFNENIWIPIRISLKFVPKGPINNIPGLVQIMASPSRRQAIIWTNDG